MEIRLVITRQDEESNQYAYANLYNRISLASAIFLLAPALGIERSIETADLFFDKMVGSFDLLAENGVVTLEVPSTSAQSELHGLQVRGEVSYFEDLW